MGCGSSSAAQVGATDSQARSKPSASPASPEKKYETSAGAEAEAKAETQPSHATAASADEEAADGKKKRKKKSKASEGNEDGANPLTAALAASSPAAVGSSSGVSGGPQSSARVVRSTIPFDSPSSSVWSLFTGAGSRWGCVRASSPLSAATPLFELIVVAAHQADGLMLGLVGAGEPLATLPGSIPGSVAWNPARGQIVCNSSVLAQATPIAPRPGDRISMQAEEGGRFLVLRLNDGLVCRGPMPGSSTPFVPCVSLIGGSSVVLAPPCTPDQSQVREELRSAARVAITLAATDAAQEAEVKRTMAKAARAREAEVEAAANAAAANDATLAAGRAELAAIAAAERERAQVRAVQLKLRALRALACPSRRAVAVWRKYAARMRARGRKPSRPAPGASPSLSLSNGSNPARQLPPLALARQPSVKRAPSLVAPSKPATVRAPSTLTGSFRSVGRTRVLRPQVTLVEYESKDPRGATQIEWELRNEGAESWVATMDLSKCSGMELHGEAVQKSLVKPYETKLIALVCQAKPRAPYGINYKIDLQAAPGPSAQVELAAVAQVEAGELERAVVAMREAGISVPPPGASDPHVSLLSQLAPKSLSFVDASFPPQRSSVYSNESSTLSRELPLAWRRLLAFMPPDRPPSLFSPSVDPNDIQQGRLGNCWLASSLSAVAETPELVARCFPQPTRINTSGVYAVRLCLSGQWRDVLLDDWFPCYTGAGPLFSRNRSDQIWVLLLEKALAKCYGGYDRLISGQAQHALADLTGYPIRYRQFEHAACKPLLENGADALWRELLEAAQQDLSCCAGTMGQEQATDATNARLKSVGLVAGHAYTLLNCFAVPQNASTSRGVRLLELRNPWASGEWTGNWSDKSPLWTDELKELLKPRLDTGVEDGLFYMQFEDFLQYFASVSTCFIRSPRELPWTERRFSDCFVSTRGDEKRATLSGAMARNLYVFDVSAVSDAWVALYQPCARLPGAPPLVDQGVMLLRLGDDGQVVEIVADTTVESDRQSNVAARLQSGTYAALAYTPGARLTNQWEAAGLMAESTTPSREFSLALFLDSPSAASSVRAQPLTPELYESALLLLLRTRGSVSTLGKENQLRMHQLRHGSSHLYAAEIDAQYSKSMSVTLDSASSRNARSHVGEAARVTHVLAPGQMRLFHHLSHMNPDIAASYNVDIAFKTHKSE